MGIHGRELQAGAAAGAKALRSVAAAVVVAVVRSESD